MSSRLDHMLVEVGVVYADALRSAERDAVGEAMSAATVLAALDAVKRYQEAGLFSADWAGGLRSHLTRRGPSGLAYQRNVETLEAEARAVLARDGLPAALRYVTGFGGTRVASNDVHVLTERLAHGSAAPSRLTSSWRRWSAMRSRRREMRRARLDLEAAALRPARESSAGARVKNQEIRKISSFCC